MSPGALNAATAAPVRPGSLRAWLLAFRPATLPVGAAPVVLGAAAAFAWARAHGGAFRALPALAALVGALLIQIGTNLANDVFDHEKGADTAARLGPVRATQAGLLRARHVRLGMVASFALAVVVGVYLTLSAGLAVVAIGVLSVLSGVLYTGGPWPLGYHGLGDVFVLVFFGPVAVCGTALVACGTVPSEAVFASVSAGALATAVLVVNNVRDAPTDVRAGKRTLVVRFGRAFGVGEYGALLAAALLAPVAMVVLGVVGGLALLPLATAPAALLLLRAVARREGAALNPYLGRTAALLLGYSALLSLGLVLQVPS
jgi:1,4-dihydroxy-2-naphthoate octaprenyltransferase